MKQSHRQLINAKSLIWVNFKRDKYEYPEDVFAIKRNDKYRRRGAECVGDKIGVITKEPTDIKIPEEIQIPSTSKFKFLLYAIGTAEYNCTCEDDVKFWNITNYDTFLTNDIPIGYGPECFVVRHYFSNPPYKGGRAIYESLVPGDTSFVWEAPDASIPSPDGPENLAWIRILPHAVKGKGALNDFTYALRIATVGGGSPPNSTCGTDYELGDVVHIRYTSQNRYYH
ncbi:1775_t:CDS:2 [Scutellospora calospora]|uniref:1775_t:CDS:1 n=1 Tax=Scutellospora calospora TaxID=85575 RepID=A0ACA9K6R4_9GLOM|nr:1775_t:CDS:2 [Scutellospora calospora]